MSEVLFVKIVYVKTSVSDSDNVDVIFDKLFFYIYDNTHLDNRDKKLLAACVYFWCFMRYSGIIDVIK